MSLYGTSYQKSDEYHPRQSVVTLDVKPWDDETDMKALEDCVRSIEQEGLLWGASKLVPIGFGIKKLQMTIVIGKSVFKRFLNSVVSQMVIRG
jgi:translation elongation factor EF-1beta